MNCSTKSYLKFMAVLFVAAMIYEAIRIGITGEPDLTIAQWVGQLCHVIIFWFLIPRAIYRKFRKLIGKPVNMPISRKMTDEEIVEAWINAGAA